METAEEIRLKMRATRVGLKPEVNQAVHDAQTLMDWRYYVTQFPLAAAGVAVAAGYFLVPRKLNVTSPDADTLVKLAKQRKLVVEPQSRAVAKAGPLSSLATIVTSMAFRAGLAYIGQQLGKNAPVADAKASRASEGERVYR